MKVVWERDIAFRWRGRGSGGEGEGKVLQVVWVAEGLAE